MSSTQNENTNQPKFILMNTLIIDRGNSNDRVSQDPDTICVGSLVSMVDDRVIERDAWL